MPEVKQENEVIFKIEQDSRVMFSHLAHAPLKAASVNHLRRIQQALLAAFLDVEKKVQERIFKEGNGVPVFVNVTNGSLEKATYVTAEEQLSESGDGAQGAIVAAIAAVAKAIDDCAVDIELRPPSEGEGYSAECEADEVADLLMEIQERIEPSESPEPH